MSMEMEKIKTYLSNNGVHERLEGSAKFIISLYEICKRTGEIKRQGQSADLLLNKKEFDEKVSIHKASLHRYKDSCEKIGCVFSYSRKAEFLNWTISVSQDLLVLLEQTPQEQTPQEQTPQEQTPQEQTPQRFEEALKSYEHSYVASKFKSFFEDKKLERAGGTIELSMYLYRFWSRSGAHQLKIKEQDLMRGLNVSCQRSVRRYRSNLRDLGLIDSSIKEVCSEKKLVMKLTPSFFDVFAKEAPADQSGPSVIKKKAPSDQSGPSVLKKEALSDQSGPFAGPRTKKTDTTLSIDSTKKELENKYSDDSDSIDEYDEVYDTRGKVLYSKKVFPSPFGSPSLFQRVPGYQGSIKIDEKQPDHEKNFAQKNQKSLDNNKAEKSFYSVFKHLVYNNHANKDNNPFYESFFIEYCQPTVEKHFDSLEHFENYCQAISRDDFLMGRAKKPFVLTGSYFFSEPIIAQWKAKVGPFKEKYKYPNDPAVDYDSFKKYQSAGTSHSYSRIPDSVAHYYADKQNTATFDGWIKKELYKLCHNKRMPEFISWFATKEMTFKIHTSNFEYEGEMRQEEYLLLEASPFMRDNIERRFDAELKIAFQNYFEQCFGRLPYRCGKIDINKVKRVIDI